MDRFGIFSRNLDVPSNVLQKKRVARILVFKIRPSQEILKIRDSTPLEMSLKKRVARILVFKIRPSQEILKIRDAPLEAEEILTYRKKPRNGSVWYFSSKLDVRSKVLQKKIVARILVFKIWPSQQILKIRDGTPLEAEEILTYRKKPRNGSVWYFSSKLDVLSKVLRRKEWHGFWYSKSGHLKKFTKFVIKIVARILVFKIRPSQEILKIRDGTHLEAEEILTYRKSPRNGSKRVARILVFKIRPSQEILKIRDEWHGFYFSKFGHLKKFSKFVMVPLGVKKRVARIMVFKISPSQEIHKTRDGTPLEAEEILTYRKKPYKWTVKKRVARILVSKIRPSQEINIILDGTPLEAEEILTYRKALETDRKEWHGFYFSKFGHLKKFSKFVMVPLGGGRNFDIHKKALEMDRFGNFLEILMSLVMYYRRKEWHGFWFSKLGHLKKFSKFVM
ncbi:hypothetical protein OROHE_008822 [Orobanche hederae]